LAAFNKFNQFSDDLIAGHHEFDGSATYKVMLTNTQPSSTNQTYSDVSANEVASGNGYTTGGLATTMSNSQSSGTTTVFATNVTWTATGTVGPLRYAIVYRSDDTHKGLVCWFDYGSSVTLNNGDTFTVSFDPTNGLLQLS